MKIKHCKSFVNESRRNYVNLVLQRLKSVTLVFGVYERFIAPGGKICARQHEHTYVKIFIRQLIMWVRKVVS